MCVLLCALFFQTRFETGLRSAFTFALAASHCRSRWRTRAGRDSIAANVLLRFVGSHLVRVNAAASAGWRLFHFGAVLIARAGGAHLLAAWLGADAGFVLILFWFHVWSSLVPPQWPLEAFK